MYFNGPPFTKIINRPTSHADAWKNKYWETYRLDYELPAVRLHARTGRCWGRWFAVDTYNVSIRAYQQLMAMLTKNGAKPWTYVRPDLDSYVLLPGSILNAGIANAQGFHEGGGLQLEYVSGPQPQFLDHASDRKRVRL